MSDLSVLTFGDFELSARRRTLTHAGRPLRIGSRAMDILLLLAERPGELVTKDEIQDRVWPGIFVEDASIRVHMSSLRKALGGGASDYIHTVAGRGYILVPPVSRAADPDRNDEQARAENLPLRLERLIGRAAVVDSLAAQVLQRRFVTLVGPGGIGKTSVALETATRLADAFADGLRFVDLAALEDSEAAPGALALALGIPALSDLSAAALAKPLAGKRLLVVLDNCERLADVAASVAEALLGSNLHICVLATSREALRAAGEWLHRLPPLATPTVVPTSPTEAMTYSAIELFVDRADAASGGYRLSEADCPVVVEICRRLDGLPLAIELAATTVTTLGVRGVAVGLDDRLALLTGGRRTAQSRHQTLRAALDWSYDLLSPAERNLLHRLSVVAGAFDLGLACEVGSETGRGPETVRALVGALAEKSLIAVDTGGRDVRYRLLESTRAYAAEKLAASGDRDAAMQSYAQATLGFFRDGEPPWEGGGRHAWLELHASRLDDARATLDWAFSRASERPLARALTTELTKVWLHLGLARECVASCRRALERPEGVEAEADAYEMRLQHAYGVADGAKRGADPKNGAAIAATIELAERLGNHDYRIRGLWALATLQLNGQLNLALENAERLRDVAAGPDATAERLVGERMMGSVLHLLGRQAEARTMLERAQAACAAIDRKAAAMRFQFDQLVLTQGFLAWTAWMDGDDARARALTSAAIAEAADIDHPGSLGFALDVAVTLAILQDDLDAARRDCERLTAMGATIGYDVWMARSKVLGGLIRVKSGDLTGGVPALREALAPPIWNHTTYRTPLFLAELARAESAVGRHQLALTTIDEAIGWFHDQDDFWCAPECFRVKAGILRRRGATGATAQSEALLRRAHAIAERQGAAAWRTRLQTARAG